MAEHNPFPGENNTGHFWDDNIRELNNPPPQWWMIALWASLAWFILYGILYPMFPVLPWQSQEGGGFTKGILGWSSIKEYEQGVEQVEEVRAQYEDQIAGMSAEEILDDPGLTQYTLASAKVLFGDYCSACHGSGGQGNPGYPVLADDNWLYGGSLAKIQESITNGRKGAMTAHKDVLTEAQADTLANWVVEMAETQGEGGSDAGWKLYNEKGCNACHGAEANGVLAELPDGSIVTVGAANLRDSIWRFRPGGYESAKHTILYGVNQPGVEQTRDAVMPAFGDAAGSLDGKLEPDQIKKLAVYVHSLGGGQ
ncbi:cytochrome-c oxidase, cbb3-type subunit III [Halochromatium glycolicum]|uniref:Cbb3-type cytochrome c oxidase subunit n=1 Tax=Halochromatium glycolicum TaxID=85075 RepID=A0AAJ0U8L1_9GAMM|nr:cytochrome-c oxidase, cbb3-type subunit III [Halochromatium glycolicum]MBK1707203.1 cytochrome-c oxidase, cbb3-type subunit III [Halochromatium glycolicum]